ncbi:MAG: helix-turn-helix transcriptional regulator [Clostridia bacterium]|nr:helix-turn-helix transcriptional regulator [Clostridia bacterium]
MSIILPEIVDTGIFNSSIWGFYQNMVMSNDRRERYYVIDIPFMTSGVKYINDVPFALKENMMIMTKPGERKHATLPYKCYFIHFENTSSDIKHILDSLPTCIYNINTTEYIEILSEISYYFHNKTDKNTLMIQQLALKLLYRLTEDAERQERTDNAKVNKHLHMQKYTDYIKNNLAEDLSLESLADLANFSPIYFHTCFKEYTGKTLREFVEAERIKKACILLSSGEMTIEKIAEACGFSSRSYFCVVFKRRMKLTPREYALLHAKPSI